MSELAVWQRTIVDERGNVIPGAEVSVRSYPGGSLITLYEGPDGTQVKGNPFITGTDGFARFWAESQRAEIVAHGAGSTIRWVVDLLNADEVIGDAVTEATAAAAAAVSEAKAEADRAEAARDAAQLSAGVYADEAAGLAATTEGDYFNVPSVENNESLVLYLHDVGGVATPLVRYPSTAMVEDRFNAAIDAAQPREAYEFKSGIDLPWAYAITDEDGKPFEAWDGDGNALSTTPSQSELMPYVLGEFHSSDNTAVAYAITDEDGKPFEAWDGDGNELGTTPSQSELMPYVLGDELRAVGAEDELAANIGNMTALSVAPGNGHVRAVLDWPALSDTRTVAAAKGWLIPDNRQVLHIVIGLGQSLMIGARGDDLISVEPIYPSRSLMFDSGANSSVRMGLDFSGGSNPALDPNSLVGFKPHVSVVGQANVPIGETLLNSHANTLIELADSVGVHFKMLSFTAAKGGTRYELLKKGTQPYTNMISAVNRAVELAEQHGWKVIVDACVVKHGEADDSNDNYAQDLLEWQSDVDTDIKSVTGQLADVHFIIGQPSNFLDSSTKDAVRAMLEVHNTSPVHHLSGPDYPFLDHFSFDYLHFNAPGYYLIGEQIARTWKQVLWSSSQASSIVQMTGASLSGTTVTVDFSVPQPPLVIDTTTIAERDTAGFTFTSDGVEIDILTATVTDDGSGDGEGKIELELSTTPAGSVNSVQYGFSGQTEDRGAAGVPRGNVRDSAKEVSTLDGRRLYNWAVHQEITVE